MTDGPIKDIPTGDTAAGESGSGLNTSSSWRQEAAAQGGADQVVGRRTQDLVGMGKQVEANLSGGVQTSSSWRQEAAAGATGTPPALEQLGQSALGRRERDLVAMSKAAERNMQGIDAQLQMLSADPAEAVSGIKTLVEIARVGGYTTEQAEEYALKLAGQTLKANVAKDIPHIEGEESLMAKLVGNAPSWSETQVGGFLKSAESAGLLPKVEPPPSGPLPPVAPPAGPIA
jgi:hypothetical protein